MILKNRIKQEEWHRVIMAKRYTPQEALPAELVDELVDDSAEVAEENKIIKAGGVPPPPKLLVQRAVEIGAEHAPKVASGAWASLKVRDDVIKAHRRWACMHLSSTRTTSSARSPSRRRWRSGSGAGWSARLSFSGRIVSSGSVVTR